MIKESKNATEMRWKGFTMRTTLKDETESWWTREASPKEEESKKQIWNKERDTKIVNGNPFILMFHLNRKNSNILVILMQKVACSKYTHLQTDSLYFFYSFPDTMDQLL